MIRIANKYDDWVGNLQRERHLKNQIVKPVLEEYKQTEKLEGIFEVIKNQKSYK